jgi:hypothetical protein
VRDGPAVSDSHRKSRDGCMHMLVVVELSKVGKRNSIDIIPLQRRKDDVAKATTTSRNDPKKNEQNSGTMAGIYSN